MAATTPSVPSSNETMAATTPSVPSPDEAATLTALWEDHMRCEFVAKDADATMATMDTADPSISVNHVPVMTGGLGAGAIKSFYAQHFIPSMPPDTKTTLVSRTVGTSQVVDELIFSFTHTQRMDWMLPGVAPTGRRVEVGLVVIVGAKGGKVVKESIFWDQASVLVQVGLLDPTGLPVAGAEAARKVADPASEPSNALIHRSRSGGGNGGDAVPCDCPPSAGVPAA
jgi:carboxymethylenebutenolidase